MSYSAMCPWVLQRQSNATYPPARLRDRNSWKIIRQHSWQLRVTSARRDVWVDGWLSST